MGTNYKQFSSLERDQIAILLARGRSRREIAKALGRNLAYFKERNPVAQALRLTHRPKIDHGLPRQSPSSPL